ncbi:MAG TPA: serine hydrolase domain-containing protein, partial [Solirubrobacteraceae bacterium]
MIDGEPIDTLLQQAVNDGVFPGVIAIAGNRDGMLYEGAFGQLSVHDQTPVVPDTTIALASMTKAITSVAALQLIEQGRLDLEQPVASVLPAFGELQVLEGFDDERPRLRPPSSQAS